MSELSVRLVELTLRQVALREDLVHALDAAAPLVAQMDDAMRSAERSYRAIALVLVELRHEFTGPDGRTPDLRGRSRGYREVVRRAYVAAGVGARGPIQKRLTVGVAYWVRKLLVERYGEEHLRELGILPVGSFASVAPRAQQAPAEFDDPLQCLVAVVDALNQLATDPVFAPSADLVRSATRAVVLLQHKLASGRPAAA